MTAAPDPIGGMTPGIATPTRAAFGGNALGVASMILWAAGFPAAEILLETWPPLTLITARFALAVAMLVTLWLILEGPAALRRANWGAGLRVGSVCFGLGAWCLLIAQDLTDPVTVAIIASTCPLAATIIEVATGQRRLRANFLLGLAFSLVGGVIASGSGGFSADLGLGALAAVVSCFLFSWGSFASVRDFPDLSALGRSTVTLAGGGAMTLALLAGSIILGYDMAPATGVDLHQLGLVGIYAVAGMALSQVLFIASVGRLGIAVASFHVNVAPFYVMLILLSLGQPWSWPQAIGAAIVGAGVVLSQRR